MKNILEISTKFLKKALFIAVALSLFGCFSSMANASCGDYLRHSMSSSVDSNGNPTSPTSPGCRGGKCRAQLPAAPNDSSMPRIKLGEFLRDGLDGFPPFLADLISTWRVIDFDAPTHVDLDVIYRPPIA